MRPLPRFHKHRRTLITTLALLAIASLSALDHTGAFGHQQNDHAKYDGALATVTYAADGDTIDVDIPDVAQSKTRIRLWGVDCPELAHAATEQNAYFAPEAKALVVNRIVGRRVRLALEPSRPARDKYGRLLAYVYLLDTGEMLNELLIRRGLGYADRRFNHVCKHRFLNIEKRAQRTKAGLWAAVTPDQTPAWRQRMLPPTPSPSPTP